MRRQSRSRDRTAPAQACPPFADRGTRCHTRVSMSRAAYAQGPSDTPLRGETIGGMWDAVVAAHGDRPALVSRHQGIRWTYAELHDRVERCARALIAAGVRK